MTDPKCICTGTNAGLNACVDCPTPWPDIPSANRLLHPDGQRERAEAAMRAVDPEPEDTCRPVEVDGETIRVRGAAEMSDEGREALASLVRAAKAKLAAEPIPIRTQLRHWAFNAVAPALRRHGEWMRLTVRRTVADAVLEAIEEFLDIGEAEAWCKSCRRVWDGKDHRCESDAEQRLAQARNAAALHRKGLISDSELYAVIEAGSAFQPSALNRVVALYEQWVKAGPPPIGTPMARWWDRRLAELHTAILPTTDQTQERP